jgi:hypothetical protein
MSDEPMTDRPDGKRWGWRGTAGIAGLVLVVYALSLGPYVWLDRHGGVPDALQRLRIYTPIQRVRDYGPAPVQRAINWYMDLWGLHAPHDA